MCKAKTAADFQPLKNAEIYCGVSAESMAVNDPGRREYARRKKRSGLFLRRCGKARVGKGESESGFHFAYTKFPEKFTKRGAGACLAARI